MNYKVILIAWLIIATSIVYWDVHRWKDDIPISDCHNAQIRIQGSEHTTLNLLQQGNTNQSYSLTQNCYTVGGCTVNVSQGN